MSLFSELKLPSNRKFGLFFTAIFALLAAYLKYQGLTKAFVFAVFLVCLVLFVTLTKAEILQPFNALWMRFGVVLGMVISPIVIGLIFFLMITPVALLMRVFGRDALSMKKSYSNSHWKTRGETDGIASSFTNQF